MSKILESIATAGKIVVGTTVGVTAVGLSVYGKILEERYELEKEISNMEKELETKKKRLAEIKGAK